MGKMFFFSGYDPDTGQPDGDTRGNGRDKWVENEVKAVRLHEKEGKYEGYEKAPVRKPLRGPGGKDVAFLDAGALGLDGKDFHYGGERVSFLKEERLSGGDFNVYFQLEGGGTMRMPVTREGDGRHRFGQPRKTRSF